MLISLQWNISFFHYYYFHSTDIWRAQIRSGSVSTAWRDNGDDDVRQHGAWLQPTGARLPRLTSLGRRQEDCYQLTSTCPVLLRSVSVSGLITTHSWPFLVYRSGETWKSRKSLLPNMKIVRGVLPGALGPQILKLTNFKQAIETEKYEYNTQIHVL